MTFILLTSCSNKHTLFNKVSSDHSGIHFNNQITENDSINPLDVTNMYNGGGVGIGDFNNDGLQDIYFTGNMVENKLYLNKGNLDFNDITKEAGVQGEGRWCRGVAVVDINNDGWLDLYVCATISKDPAKRKNLLYINQGIDKDGIPHFKEMAAEYGLDDTTHSTMAAFFDYDNDGDLDMYLVVNEIHQNENNPSIFRPKFTDGSFYSTGRLYRNDWNENLKHPVFTNVTKQAGVTTEGYGHGVSIADFNQDGWKDIFITNDFLSNDLLYINNHDGTFADRAREYFKHTSANGMGQDVIDINNDGLADVVELDMNPEDNYRKKMMMNGNSYQTYQNSDYFGYQYQYVRNSLQLNQGPRVSQMDSIGAPIFSEIGFQAGMAETDWSWTPLVQDFDNDGWRDIIITNGYPKDVTDHDFTSYRSQSAALASKQFLLSQIPQVKIHNYAYRNNGDLTFSNHSIDWGFETPTFSNGAAYVDLDNDGDLDIVINNINDEASVLENATNEQLKENKSNYLSIRLKGDSLNRNGLGTFVELYANGSKQVYEESPYRGYLSTDELNPHFGLGPLTMVDSLVIKWPNKKEQVLKQVQANKTIEVNIKDANLAYSWAKAAIAQNTLFKDITDSIGIHYQQHDSDFIDFNIQRLLPHKFSEYGPALAVGDLDGNGLDDIVCGGSAWHSAMLFLQQPGGKFISKSLLPHQEEPSKISEDIGILLFDADKDGDLDIYIASGSYENSNDSPGYQDMLYVNDGKGNFKPDSTALPTNHTSKSCVRAIDFDKDGDLDLLIAGRVIPGQYPKPVSSYIYRNDSKDGHIKFTDVTATVAPALKDIGLVCDAAFTDFDNDGWPDLILAGEWMPITFLKNDHGLFKNVTSNSGINNYVGWWNSITPGDFDNDGDIDYVVGNLGRNSFYRASDKYPVCITAADFDNNGSFDAIPSLFLPASATDTARKEFPAQNRDDILKQYIGLRKKFENYKSYAVASMDKVLTDEQRRNALRLQANFLQSVLIRNDGNGNFTIIPLPPGAQVSALNGMVTGDFNHDGHLDIVINGNDYGTEVSVGRYDALNGLLLYGDGNCNFTPASIMQSGIFIPGNGKALVSLRGAAGNILLAASQNRGPLKIFECKKKERSLQLDAMDEKAILTLKDGKKQVVEINYGSSFLSQSGRFLMLDENIVAAEIIDNKGNKRTVKL